MGCEYSVPVANSDDYQVVHHQPAVLFDNSIQPGTEPGHVYHLKMRRKLWRTWTHDSFGVRYATDGRPFEANVKGKVWSARNRMVLRNLQGVPIGVMLKMYGRFERTFKIYGFTPLYAGQVPSKQHGEEFGRQLLYTWAEVVDPAYSITYTMKTYDGSFYVADRVGAVMGPTRMRVSKNGGTFLRTRFVFVMPYLSARLILFPFFLFFSRVDLFTVFCAMVEHESFFSGLNGPVWDLRIAPGIDPCLVICFTAIVDELMELKREANRTTTM